MKKLFKVKTTVTLLFSLLALTAFASCSSAKKETAQDTTPTQASAPAAPIDLGASSSGRGL